MKITKVSPFTGVEHTMEIDVQQYQIDIWKAGELIQNAMPNLTPDEREFFISGLTAAEFDELFKESE